MKTSILHYLYELDAKFKSVIGQFAEIDKNFYSKTEIDEKISNVSENTNSGSVINGGLSFISSIIHSGTSTGGQRIWFSIGSTYLGGYVNWQSSFLPVKPSGAIRGLKLAIFTTPNGVVGTDTNYDVLRVRKNEATSAWEVITIKAQTTIGSDGWTGFPAINTSGGASPSNSGYTKNQAITITDHKEGDGYIVSISTTSAVMNAGNVWQCEYSFVTE